MCPYVRREKTEVVQHNSPPAFLQRLKKKKKKRKGKKQRKKRERNHVSRSLGHKSEQES